jgi:hypothetical protein
MRRGDRHCGGGWLSCPCARQSMDLYAMSGSDRSQPARSWVQNSAGR